MKYVFDIEADGLLGNISTIWCLVLQDIDTGEQYAYSNYDDDLPPLKHGLDRLVDAELLVGHNIIGYDIPAIEKVTGYELLDKRCHDTLTLSMALQYRRNHKHGLAGWGEALGNDKLDYHDWSGYSREMLDYCRQDVRLNAEVYTKLLGEYSRLYSINPLIKRGLEVEHEVAKFNTITRNQGWFFDMDKARENLSGMVERSEFIEDYFRPKLGTRKVYIDKEPKTPKYKKNGDFNSHTVKWLSEYFGYEVAPGDVHVIAPGTPFQRSKTVPIELGQTDLVKEYLLGIGWKPDEYVKKKIDGKWIQQGPKLTDSSLFKLGEVGELISEYYTLRNRISVIKGWIEQSSNSRLHGNMWTIGTPSFRCRHEVIVNLPAVSAAYGKQLRELFRAEPGWTIVGADSSGNQLRGLCHYVGNDEYTDVVVNGDQHQRNADALGCSRPAAKTFLYAYLFGAGDAKLGQAVTGKLNSEKGKKARADFSKSVSGLAEIKAKVESEWREKEYRQGIGWIHGLDGRPVFVPSEHQCLNYLLQCAEGITCKAACAYSMRKIREEGLRANPRLFYHDELAWTAHPDDAARVGEILQESFREAPKWFGVNCMDGGDYVIGESYADVH